MEVISDRQELFRAGIMIIPASIKQDDKYRPALSKKGKIAIKIFKTHPFMYFSDLYCCSLYSFCCLAFQHTSWYPLTMGASAFSSHQGQFLGFPSWSVGFCSRSFFLNKKKNTNSHHFFC